MAKSLFVPLADVYQIASHLQFIKDKQYGDVLSAKQIMRAENIIRRLIREHLDGKWPHQRKAEQTSAATRGRQKADACGAKMG